MHKQEEDVGLTCRESSGSFVVKQEEQDNSKSIRRSPGLLRTTRDEQEDVLQPEDGSKTRILELEEQ